jgi:hypothetical protein
MDNETPNVCGVRTVRSPDAFDVPVPAGGVGLPSGETIDIREDADVQASSKSASGFYVAINNAAPANDEAERLFGEFATESGLEAIGALAVSAFGAAVATPIAVGAFLVGELVSLFTPSNLTREIFIRGQLNDGTPITYCLLV